MTYVFYSCRWCGRGYASEAACQRHMYQKHPQEELRYLQKIGAKLPKRWQDIQRGNMKRVMVKHICATHGPCGRAVCVQLVGEPCHRQDWHAHGYCVHRHRWSGEHYHHGMGSAVVAVDDVNGEHVTIYA